MNKKKPVFTVARAHGAKNWISAVAAVPYSDLVASGSRCGFVRLWSAGEKKTRLSLVMKIAMDGWVNALRFTADGSFLIAGGGKVRVCFVCFYVCVCTAVPESHVSSSSRSVPWLFPCHSQAHRRTHRHTDTQTHTQTHGHTHAHTDARTHTRTHTDTDTHTHTHTDTHKHTLTGC